MEKLSEYAGDGWRVASVDLTPHASFGAGMLPVLLERDVQVQAERTVQQ